MPRTPLVAGALIVALAGCAPRYDVNVAWTVGGFAPAVACTELSAPSIRFRLEQQDAANGPFVEDTVEEIESAPCTDGVFTVHSAASAKLFVELLENDAVYGTAGPLPLAPNAGAAYEGQDASAPLRSNIVVRRGRLHARFTVVGEDCDKSGATSFTATIRQNTAPQAEEIVAGEESIPVSCAVDTDGVNVGLLDYEPVEVGSLYDIVATTQIGGVSYSTTNDGGGGDGAVVTGLVTNLLVDLDVEGAGQ